MTADISSMRPVKRALLKAALLRTPDRPRPFDLVEIREGIDYEKFSDEEVWEAMRELLDEGFFRETESGYHEFEFLREGFLSARRKFRWYILSNSNHFSLLIGIPLSLLITLIFVSSIHYVLREVEWISGSEEGNLGGPDPRPTLAEINSRLARLESRVDLRKTSSIAPDTEADLEAIRESVEEALALSNSLGRLLTEDPSKVLDLAAVRTELDRLRENQDRELASLHREFDRVSGYNRTIILFMVTFMIAFFGLGLFNLFKTSHTDTERRI